TVLMVDKVVYGSVVKLEENSLVVVGEPIYLINPCCRLPDQLVKWRECTGKDFDAIQESHDFPPSWCPSAESNRIRRRLQRPALPVSYKDITSYGIVGLLENVGLAGIELTVHALDNPVADIGSHHTFE